MNNRLFGFLVLPLCLAGLMGLSAVDTACTPAPRKASHGGIMVVWEDAQLLAPGGYARAIALTTEAIWPFILAEETDASR